MSRRLADVALKVGVSEATVSRVLNGKPGVSDGTREAVLTALDVLGYERPTKLRGERARLVGLVLPELQGKIDGVAIRAPVPTGSIVDLVVHLTKEVTVDEVNDVFRAEADTGRMKGILAYTDEPFVSTDIQGSPYSCIFDSELTLGGGHMVKVFGWYYNEWGYSCRLFDVVTRL